MAEEFPYVGSLMSLVTQNAARYEGVLTMVDMPNSSITLSGGMFVVLILVFGYRRVSGQVDPGHAHLGVVHVYCIR